MPRGGGDAAGEFGFVFAWGWNSEEIAGYCVAQAEGVDGGSDLGLSVLLDGVRRWGRTPVPETSGVASIMHCAVEFILVEI